MAKSMEEMIKSQRVAGAQVANSWGSRLTRSGHIDQYQVGDIITFPDDLKILKRTFGTTEVYYCMVNVKRGNTTLVMPFYPSSFVRSRQKYNDDGTPTNTWVEAKGTACDLYQAYSNENDAMPAVIAAANKGILVSKDTPVKTLRFGTDSLTTNHIFDFDFVK